MNDATVAQLILGLENTSGQFWFDDVSLTVLRDPGGPQPGAARAGV